MNKKSLILFAVINTLVVALIASYLTTKWHDKSEHHAGHEHHGHSHGGDFHTWVHTQLKLTPEQDAALHSVEQDYDRRSKDIRLAVEQGSKRLGYALKEKEPDQKKIDSALRAISRNQAAQRELMIEHFFAMKEHLDEEQAEKLRDWLYVSLSSQKSVAH